MSIFAITYRYTTKVNLQFSFELLACKDSNPADSYKLVLYPIQIKI